MSQTDALYLEINLMCFAILAYISIRLLFRADRQVLPRIFRGLVGCLALVDLSDAGWRLVHAVPGQSAHTLSYIFNCGYFFFLGLGAYLWFIYSERTQKSPLAKDTRSCLLSGIPALLLSVMILLSPCTGWIFSVDALNRYHRGPLHMVQVVISAAYLVVTSIKALIKLLDKNYYVQRRTMMSIAFFALLPTLSVPAQVLLGYDIPIQCAALTMAALFVFDASQEARITIDTLTQISNRDLVLRYISRKLGSSVPDKRLSVLMLDIDNFKVINDQYGHLEGDAALVRLANVLKVSVPRDFIIGRFGGDEFIIAGEAEDEMQLDWVSMSIREALDISNREASAPFSFTVSIGRARVETGRETVCDLIHTADMDLYHAKRKKRAANLRLK